MSEYDLGYERGQLRAEEELRRAGFVRPFQLPSESKSAPAEYDRGYEHGWNNVASRSLQRRRY